MGVGVAGSAGGEVEPGKPWRLPGRDGRMALRASDFCVQAGEGITGFGVIEAAYVFPVGGVVAGLAILAQSALVKVFMAGHAGTGEPKKALVGIFLTNQRPHLRLHEFCRVALLALDRRVLAFQSIAGLAMIELLLRRLPVDEAEVFTVVFGMAARAILVWIVSLDHSRVEALVCGEALVDFSVAVQTLEASAAAELVAAGALRHA